MKANNIVLFVFMLRKKYIRKKRKAVIFILFNVKINNKIETMHGENSEEVLRKVLNNKKYKNSHIGFYTDDYGQISAVVLSNDLSYEENIIIRKKNSVTL